MSRKPVCWTGLILALVVATGGPAMASDLWLHVKVTEKGGAKVMVNLPVALVEKAAALMPEKHLRHVKFDHGHLADIGDLRELWQEVRKSPDMTFVTVEEADENVKVWKKDGFVFVEVRGGDDEQVDVKVPLEVVDAFLAGEEVDFTAAVQALVDHGQGQFVEVRDDEDHVRVWVDEVAEGE